MLTSDVVMGAVGRLVRSNTAEDGSNELKATANALLRVLDADPKFTQYTASPRLRLEDFDGAYIVGLGFGSGQFLELDGKPYGIRDIIGWRPGPSRTVPARGLGHWDSVPIFGTWHPLSTSGSGKLLGIGGDEIRHPEILRSIQSHFSIALTVEYDWSVVLRTSTSGQGVRVTVSPAGCRELFKLRDLEPGKSRRSALLHWVMAHSRRKPTSEDLAWVRKHLRGRTAFSWDGLCGFVEPSKSDLRDMARASTQKEK